MMEHGNRRVLVPVIVAALLGPLPFVAAPTRAISGDGWVSGEGHCFEVTNSTYLNVTLCSTEVVNVTLESVPSVVSFIIKGVGDVMSTDVTMSGLEPNETYYRHQDGYGIEAFAADEAGNYSYTQGLSSPHHVFIDQESSTKYLRDDATGGDCTSIGTWNWSTKTCTLTMNVLETIVIDGNGITLEAAGHSITRGTGSYGVYAASRAGVAVENAVVTGFSYGIYLYNSGSSMVSGNTVTVSGHISLYYSGGGTVSGNTVSSGIIWLEYSASSTVSGNTVSSGGYSGIYLLFSGSSTVSGNGVTVSAASYSAHYGIFLYSSASSTVSGNEVTVSGYYSTCGICAGAHDTVSGNTVTIGNGGDGISASNGNMVSGNTVTVGTDGRGIYLASSGNTVSGNTVTVGSAGYGIYFGYGTGAETISGNTISLGASGYAGIYISSSNSNFLTGNTISGGRYAMLFYWSSYATLTENVMSGSGIFLGDPEVTGGELIHWNTHTIDDTNTVNGKPVRYCKNTSGGTIPEGAGQVILANCPNVVVENQEMYATLQIGFSSGTGVNGNTIEGQGIGIYVWQSGGISVSGNTVTVGAGGYGLYMNIAGLSSNKVNANTFSGGYYVIVHASSPSYAPITVSGNTVTVDRKGICLSSLSTVIGNTVTVGSGGYGICLGSPGPSTVSGNTVTGGAYGIDVYYSNPGATTVDGNMVTASTYGIRLASSGGSTANANTVTGVTGVNGRGIILESSPNSALTGNTVAVGGQARAIYLESSGTTDVSGNTVSGGSYGIRLSGSSGSTLSANTVTGSSYGIRLYPGDSTASGNSISGSYYGIFVESSYSGGTISGNTIGGAYQGITLQGDVTVGGHTVSGNTVTGSTYGIYLLYSENNALSGNTVSGGAYGIYLASSNSNVLSGNAVSAGAYDIDFVTSSGTVVTGNVMTGGGIFLDDGALAHWNTHTIDDTNTVNGKPVRYCKNTSGGTIPEGAGQVILANCSNTVVENQDLSGPRALIQLGFSSGNTVRGNVVTGGVYGISLYNSGSNTIKCNALRGGYYGLSLASSSGNTIFHNNVFTYLYTSGSTNTWNNAEGQGNFWHSYGGLDDGSGGRTAGDGIGDTYLPHLGVDWYPLMRGAACAYSFPPEIQSFTASSNPEGTPVVYTARASDPERYDLAYSFDFEGDGTFDVSGPSNAASHTFSDDFTGTAKLQVSDGPKTADATTAVVVTNAIPTVSLVRFPPGTLNPSGTPITFTAGFADAGTMDTHTAAWTFDGTTYPGTVSESGGSGSVTDTFTFPAPVQRMSLRVTDDDGGWSEASNWGPVITSFTVSTGYYCYCEGGSFRYYAPAYDPEGNPITYGFDFLGDGTIDSVGTYNYADYTFLDEFDGTARAFAGDRLLTAEATAPIHVANVDPYPYITRIEAQGMGFTSNDVFPTASGVLAQLELNGDTLDSSGNGRDAALLGGDFVPSEYGQGLHVYFGWDYDTWEVLPMGIDWSAYAGELSHPFTVEFVFTPSGYYDWGSGKLLGFDDAVDDGWYHSAWASAFEARPDPQVGWGYLWGGGRHYVALVSTSASEMDVYIDGIFVGSTASGLPANPSEAIFFRDDTATSRYEQVDAVVDALRISGVRRTPEEITAIQQRLQGIAPPVPVGTTVSFAGAFWDPGILDTHTATWSFDTITIPGVVEENGGSGTVTGAYTFTTAGVYEVTLAVEDDDGGVGTSAYVNGLTALVVVYDPNGGFVTGGGWIDSPAGAYLYDPFATGKATFGFQAKYQRGQSVPSGVTDFRFTAGDLVFQSTSYEWLVIAGPKAMFKGYGTLTVGHGRDQVQMDVGFLITAVDGDLNGGGGVDRFRIKIWSRSYTGEVIYDNMRDWPDDVDPPGIGGGRITIQKG